MKKRFVLCGIMLIFYIVSIAQTPHEDTKHWNLIISDDFSSFNNTLWEKVHDMSWGLECYSDDKTVISNNTLNLTCERNPDFDILDDESKPFVSGGIWSLNRHAYSYGYFEIRTKMPPRSMGYWGGFWLHCGGGEENYCPDPNETQIWHEFDIFEPYGCESALPFQFSCGVRKTNMECFSFADWGLAPANTFLDEGFNTIAGMWVPKEASVIVNNKFVKKYNDGYVKNYVPSIPMFLYITFQIDDDFDYHCPPNQYSIFPATWQYKDFKYYQLKTKCNENIIEENFDFINHDYYVQKSYHLTNSTIPNNSNVIIRAVDDILLDGNFEVPLGSNFNAIVHYGICPGEIEN